MVPFHSCSVLRRLLCSPTHQLLRCKAPIATIESVLSDATSRLTYDRITRPNEPLLG